MEVGTTPDEAWGAIADAGGVALVLGVGITVVWRWSVRLLERLLGDQAKATEKLAEAVHKVELAVMKSDQHNTAAISSLRSSVDMAVTRLDKHETRLDRLDSAVVNHEHRLVVLETAESGARRSATEVQRDSQHQK
ncbi:hypothetical protein [Nannocystis pusilla]|uniref:hypothetical protein n=1 Tax=Nannocystis pusilla TaxID=889268 RepID=UPI003DA268C2